MPCRQSIRKVNRKLSKISWRALRHCIGFSISFTFLPYLLLLLECYLYKNFHLLCTVFTGLRYPSRLSIKQWESYINIQGKIWDIRKLRKTCVLQLVFYIIFRILQAKYKYLSTRIIRLNLTKISDKNWISNLSICK